MDAESPKSLKQAVGSNALVLGDRVFFQALFAGGKPYVFTRTQMEFLWALQQMKSVTAAALAVGQDEIWAEKFLQSRKFRAFRNAKLLEISIKNGLTLEWWYEFGKNVAEGTKTTWEGACETCQDVFTFNAYDIESERTDDMDLQVHCPICHTFLKVMEKTEAFRPSREQVEAWKELGSRLSPKIERVHHEFSKETFEFSSQEGGQ
jgi:hypothetical protein